MIEIIKINYNMRDVIYMSEILKIIYNVYILFILLKDLNIIIINENVVLINRYIDKNDVRIE